jgi:uncharacterized membrane protein YqjE
VLPACWPMVRSHSSVRLLALAVFAVLFLLCGLVAAWRARERVLRGSRLFSASIDELRQDREALEP